MLTVNEVSVAPEDVEAYGADGFWSLRGLFGRDTISYMDRLADSEARDLGRPEALFSREAKEVGVADVGLLSILQHPGLGRTLEKLTGRRLLFTQCLVFELSAGRKGHDWHVDLGSFNFMQPFDHGCSLWCSLNTDIDPQDQGGGIAALSRRHASGLSHFEDVYRLAYGEDPDREFEDVVLSRTRSQPSHEPALALGDAFIFDKDIYHLSRALRPGPVESRRALVMRFVDAQARYSRVFYDNSSRIWGQFYNRTNQLGGKLGLEDGARIAQSPLCFELRT